MILPLFSEAFPTGWVMCRRLCEWWNGKDLEASCPGLCEDIPVFWRYWL